MFHYKITANGARPKRQTTDEPATKKEETFEQELCKDKDAGEWFRLVTGEGDSCRDVIQCTSSVRTQFVLMITCIIWYSPFTLYSSMQ